MHGMPSCAGGATLAAVDFRERAVLHRRFLFAAAFASLICAGVCVSAAPTSQTSAQRHVYMIGLSGAPLVEDALRRVQERGLARSLSSEKLALRQALDSIESAGYLRQLDQARTQVVSAAAQASGRALTPARVYRYASNGMALALTDAEAARIATLPGVTGVRRERIEHVQTDAGPEWIGADKLWNAQVPGIAGTKGEGVVVGVIDTGINPTHSAFAATGPDGYAIANPRGHFYGLCASGQATCNNKLIGIYDFTDEGTQGVDSVGHGSHVSGIVAGDAMTNALQGNTVSLPRKVSGVAPHANLIMYKACVAKDSANPDGGCPESALIAAIDQAVADGVDVINYSIGGDAVDVYQLLDQGNNDASAFFRARAAGIVVAVAAGNAGPGPNSLDEPGNAPWVIGVANASHDRRFANTLGNFSGAANPPPPLAGQGYTAGYGPATIVYAGNYGNALCGIGATQGTLPTGASNPFPPGTFHGEIVICDRGTYARVEKGYNVKLGGAGGYILANAQSDGESIISDDHYLPAVHLGYAEGQQLKDWVASPGSHQGTISGVSAVLADSYGDILESSSSRGPYGGSNTTSGGGILKPDITAPGANILSAARTGSGLALMTGTSMASPHIAGAAALLIALHPNWSPAQVESALMGTALAGSVRKEDAVTPATPLDAGAGRAQLAAAAIAGLYFPLSASDFRAADPASGGNPRNLNRSGVEDEHCAGTCAFTRTVTDMSGGGTWQMSASASSGAKITVTPSQFSLASGASQTLNIGVDVSNPQLSGTWASGRIVLHKSTGGQSASDTALTVAVYAYPGTAPAFRQIQVSGPGGSMILPVNGLAALPQATFTPTNLAPATVTNMQLGVDTDPSHLYTTFPGTGKQFVLFPINDAIGVDSGNISRVFVVEITSSNAQIANLYAGIDSNSDGQPEAAEQACQSSVVAGSNVAARCVVDLRGAAAGARNVWVLVDIPQANSASTYSITLSSGIPAVSYVLPSPPGANSQLQVTGPGHVGGAAAFPLRLSWGVSGPPILPGTRYYGAVLIDSVGDISPNDRGQVAFVPLSIMRSAGNDDVVDALEPNAQRTLILESGESLKHQFIDVAGNGNLVVTTTLSGAGSVAFYAVRTDFPAASAAVSIAAAPAASTASPQWTLGSSVTSKQVTIPVSAGRWYLVAANGGSGEAQFSEQIQLTLSGAVAPAGPGAYYNPQRSGHGIFVSQAGGQQVSDWYTYLEDATPTWYVAQANAPAAGSGTWAAPMAYVNWTGSAVNTVAVVGDAMLTPIDADNLMYSWHLDGQSGSEHFARLGTGECITFNGQSAGFDGNWYAQALSGSGMDVLALPSLQDDTFYLYDGLGIARWVVGSAAPFAPSQTLSMNQLSGFCPLCAYTPISASVVGNMSVNYASPANGNYTMNFNLLPPLSGNWNINQPIVRLTGSPVCTQ